MEDEELSGSADGASASVAGCAPDAPGPKGTSIDLTVDTETLRLSGVVAMKSISKEVIAEIAGKKKRGRMSLRSEVEK